MLHIPLAFLSKFQAKEKLKHEDLKFKASLRCIVRPCIKQGRKGGREERKDGGREERSEMIQTCGLIRTT
jgi:hypothetical protein